MEIIVVAVSLLAIGLMYVIGAAVFNAHPVTNVPGAIAFGFGCFGLISLLMGGPIHEPYFAYSASSHGLPTVLQTVAMFAAWAAIYWSGNRLAKQLEQSESPARRRKARQARRIEAGLARRQRLEAD